MATQKIELTLDDLTHLFRQSSLQIKDDCRFIGKSIDPDVESSFYMDASRSNFHFIDANGQEILFSPDQTFVSLDEKSKSELINQFLEANFPDSPAMNQMIAAYSQFIPLSMSRHLVNHFAVEHGLFKGLTTGSEHSVKKIFSVQYGIGNLRLENTLSGVDCQIVAEFYINKDGNFELKKPIELSGKDAPFIYALWFNDYAAMNQFWPKQIGKTAFNNFVDDLQIIDLARNDWNYLNRLKKTRKEQDILELYPNLLTTAMNAKKNGLDFRQKLLLTELIQRTHDNFIMPQTMDSQRYSNLCEVLINDKKLQKIVLLALVVASLAVFAGLMAVSLSSFGAAPALALGAVVIGTHIPTAIMATIAAFSAAILVATSGFFALKGNHLRGVGSAAEEMLTEQEKPEIAAL